MNPVRKRRLYLIILMVMGISAAAGFALNAFNQNMMFFFSPSEVVAGKAPDNHVFRLGGMVVKGSVQRTQGTLTVHFKLTDNVKVVTVQHTGILPDLFREGQGVVAKGRLGEGGVFVADQVLAKHDENYMPPEVAGVMKTAADGKPGKANDP
ncbi:MAG TPA: cytochrome c maturation protein CcmE [Acidiferrobacteraceae bacterium]|nr:cytochrome c maturation protein CcmE [Acidiferrobacteraceae bacterium]